MFPTEFGMYATLGFTMMTFGVLLYAVTSTVMRLII